MTLRTIDVDKVVVPAGRQRQEFDAKKIEDLAESILRVGLLHPPVLEVTEVEGEVPVHTLRAGERRLRACKLLKERNMEIPFDGKRLPPGRIPYSRTIDLTPEEMYELELEENIQRADLTWQEKTAAMAKLYELHSHRAGGALPVRRFAQEVTGLDGNKTCAFEEKTQTALAIAAHLDKPEVAQAKSAKEALNIIKRSNEAILREELGRKLAASGYASGIKPTGQLLEGSAFDLAATLSDGVFDLIVTDPPYGIDMDQMGTQSGSSSGHTHEYEDSADYAQQCVHLVANAGYRVTKASAACYMFCDIRFFYQWKLEFERAGWYVWPVPIFWDKSPTGSLLGQANGPRHVYETILYAIKGNKPVNAVGTDIIKGIPGPSLDKLHPAEKPAALYEHLLSWSATPGDTILDFFCGAGRIFQAGQNFQCYVTGIEKDPRHIATAKTILHTPALL